MKKAIKYKNTYTVSFPYDTDTLQKIRSLPSRKWNSAAKNWTVPVSAFATKMLTEWGFTLTEISSSQTNTSKIDTTTVNTNVIKTELRQYQKEGVAFLNSTNGNAIIADEMGCVDGDSIVHINRNGNGRKYKISEVYTKFHGKSKSKRDNWDKNKTTYCRSLVNGEFRLHKLINILYKGKKEVVKLTLRSGKTLRLTPDHEVAIEGDEWKPAGELEKGDRVLTNGTPKCKLCGSTINGGIVIFTPKIDFVESVVQDGYCDVYDLVMDDPHRNFVANGIVVHNCGKSLQAIAWVMSHQPLKTLIVCPASLKWVWEQQFLIHAGKQVAVGSGNQPPMMFTMGQGSVLVVNYEMLVRRSSVKGQKEYLSAWGEWIKKQQPDCIIIDEVHFVKEPGAKRTKAVKTLCRFAKHKIFLSGTPVMSRPIEIFIPANLLDPENFSNRFSFAMRYCAGKHNGFGWEFKGASNLSELHDMLSHIMIRRKKEDILKELPAKQRIVVPIELSNKVEYQQAVTKFLAWVQQKYGVPAAMRAARNEIIVQLTYLKHLAAIGKMESAVEWITEYLETTGKKLVVFAHHTDIVDYLVAALNKAKIENVSLVGGTPVKQRQWVVEQFQNNDNVRVIVGNMQAMGVGLTLTAADTTLFLELGWTPTEHDQCEDRVHRIGQESDSVSAYYIVGINSIDEILMETLNNKRKVVSKVLDGEVDYEYDVFNEVMEKLKGKKTC